MSNNTKLPQFEACAYFYKAVEYAYNNFGLIGRYSKPSEHPQDNNHYERPFAYEFYHQFRKLQECCPSENSSIFISAETYKGRTCPDLTFHKYLTEEDYNNEQKGQYWICEIKMHQDNKSNQSNIIDDFKKFIDYFSYLRFNHCIFLYVDAKEEDLKTICIQIDKEIDDRCLKGKYDKVICISIDSNKNIFANTFDKIIKG